MVKWLRRELDDSKKALIREGISKVARQHKQNTYACTPFRRRMNCSPPDFIFRSGEKLPPAPVPVGLLLPRRPGGLRLGFAMLGLLGQLG